MLKSLGVFKSHEDDTIKFVYQNSNNEIIEVSLLQNKDYDVLCVPSHHYCNLKCRMCHLTEDSTCKPMTPVDVSELLSAIYQSLVVDNKRITVKKDLLLSFMGVGDPLLNFKLIEDIFKSEDSLKSLGYESVNYALATMMPINNMDDIISRVNELGIPLKIHFSMHSSKESVRRCLIPNSKVSIKEALSSLNRYRDVVRGNERIMKTYMKIHRTDDPTEIHYTLIKDVNDSLFELAMLINYLNQFGIPLKFIKFNPKDELEGSSLESNWIVEINKVLPNVRIKSYNPPGHDVGASCGKFTIHYYHEHESENEKQEFKEWEREYRVDDIKKLCLKSS